MGGKGSKEEIGDEAGFGKGKLSEVIVEVKSNEGILLATFPHFAAGVQVKAVLSYIGSTYRGRLERANGEYLLNPEERLPVGFYVYSTSPSHDLEVETMKANREAAEYRTKYFKLKAASLQDSSERKSVAKQERMDVIRAANTAIQQSGQKEASRVVTLSDVEKIEGPLLATTDEKVLNSLADKQEEAHDSGSLNTLSTEEDIDSDDSDDEERVNTAPRKK